MRCHGLPVQVLEKATPMANNQAMEILKRRLCVSIHMGNHATKYRRAVTSGGSDFCIEVLQLHLLPPHIVPKPAKAGGFIFLSGLIIEVIWRRSDKSRRNLDPETYDFQSVCAPRLNLSHGGSPFWATKTTMAD
jgi:hypothetical protein